MKRKRGETAALAQRLAKEGLSRREIAKKMGLSKRYVDDLFRDPSGERRWERLHRDTKPCPECGKPMSVISQRRGAAKCGFCNRTRYWTRERIIVAIQEWEKKHGRPPRSKEWTTAEKGVHPVSSSVAGSKGVFPTWNSAIAAAGLEPNTNHHESKHSPVIDELLEEGKLTSTEIAEKLGCHPTLVTTRVARRKALQAFARRGMIPTKREE